MGIFGLGRAKAKQSSGIARTSLSTESRIKSTLGIRSLESMPVQAAQAFRLASDPGAKTDDFVKVLEADEVLSARVLRIANSVYFRRGAEATDISKAVNAIGLDELRCLISATMLRNLLQGKHPAREQIWANAVATAIASRGLSKHTTISDGEAFLCGLLHDVGKLLMSRRGGKLYESVIVLVKQGSKTMLEAEEEVFDLNHVEVGRWLAEKWGFPEPALRAVAFHHHAWPDEPSQRGKGTSSAMLIKAADTLAHAAGIGHPAGFQAVRNAAEAEMPRVLELLALQNQSVSQLIQELRDRFESEFSLYNAENL